MITHGKKQEKWHDNKSRNLGQRLSRTVGLGTYYLPLSLFYYHMQLRQNVYHICTKEIDKSVN